MTISRVRAEGMNKQISLIITGCIVFLLSGTLAAREKVVLQLRWDHQFQFAGYYAAEWMGYYDEEGLEVEIRSAIKKDGTLLSSIDEVAQGNAWFGIGAADILIARDKGYPLVVLASIFQQSAVAFFAPKRVKLNRPADLVDLRVSRRLGDMVDIEMQAMLLAEGIDPALVEPHPFDQREGYLSEMKRGNIDVIPGYIIGTPHEALKIGLEIDSLRPSDYGIDFYGDSLFTSQQVVEENPAQVEAFIRASLKGWEYALEHPGEITGRIIDEFTPRFPIEDFPSFVRFQVDPVKDLTLYPIVQLGNVNPARWQRMHEHLKALGFVSREIRMDTFIYDPARQEQRFVARLIKVGIAIAVVAFLVAVLAVIWIHTLRKAVAVRTLSLNNEIKEREQTETAMRESEERFRRTFDKAPIGAAMVDLEYGFIRVNEALCRMTGYSEAELQKMGFPEITHPDDLEADIKQAKQLEAGEIDQYSMEKRYIKKDGEELWIQMTVRLIRDEEERPLYYIPMMEDISERKAADEQIRLKQQELIEKNAALNVILQKYSEAQNEVEEKISANLVVSVFPILEELADSELDPVQKQKLYILKRNLEDITSPILNTLSGVQYQLTPTELKISNLIKLGHSSKEIAAHMSLSIQTINSHRRSIRKKLGLINSETNLRAFLASLD